MALRFLDTNVLLYTISAKPAEATKRQKAIAIIEPMDWAISAQVLQEFYANATKVSAGGVSPEAASVLLELFVQRVATATDTALVLQAAKLAQRHKISYWDAAIIAAAQRAGAGELLSEDLNAGQVFEGVTVVNPFA